MIIGTYHNDKFWNIQTHLQAFLHVQALLHTYIRSYLLTAIAFGTNTVSQQL